MEQDRKRFDRGRGRRRVKALYAQCFVFLFGLATLIFWPRDGGSLLLMPTTASLSTTINLALRNGGRLVGAAPGVRGVVVRGDVRRLMWPMVTSGTLVLGLPAAFCGAPSTGAERAA